MVLSSHYKTSFSKEVPLELSKEPYASYIEPFFLRVWCYCTVILWFYTVYVPQSRVLSTENYILQAQCIIFWT